MVVRRPMFDPFSVVISAVGYDVCLTVRFVLPHAGGSSLAIRKPCVSLVCPIRSPLIIVSSFLSRNGLRHSNALRVRIRIDTDN